MMFNDVGMGPLVLVHKIHIQRLCTVKIIRIWHPLTVSFMIFLFKNGLLLSKSIDYIQTNFFLNEFINYRI